MSAAIRLVKEGGADIIKLDGAAEFPEAVRALVRAGIPVFAQFAIRRTALQYGIPYGAQSAPGAQAPPEMTAKLVAQAKLLEEAGASLLDFTNSGPVAGPAVVSAVKIPVIGGLGGGPWLDGRVRLAHTIGYGRSGSSPRPRPTPMSPRSASTPSRRRHGRTRRPPDQRLT